MPSSHIETARPGLLAAALACKCPRCRSAYIYKPGFLSLNLVERCPECGLELAKNDNGDGPAVFLIFLLGFALVPTAFAVDMLFSPPIWLTGSVFSALALAITFGALRPLKAYVLALQYKHRPKIWEKP